MKMSSGMPMEIYDGNGHIQVQHVLVNVPCRDPACGQYTPKCVPWGQYAPEGWPCSL